MEFYFIYQLLLALCIRSSQYIHWYHGRCDPGFFTPTQVIKSYEKERRLQEAITGKASKRKKSVSEKKRKSVTSSMISDIDQSSSSEHEQPKEETPRILKTSVIESPGQKKNVDLGQKQASTVSIQPQSQKLEGAAVSLILREIQSIQDEMTNMQTRLMNRIAVLESRIDQK